MVTSISNGSSGGDGQNNNGSGVSQNNNGGGDSQNDNGGDSRGGRHKQQSTQSGSGKNGGSGGGDGNVGSNGDGDNNQLKAMATAHLKMQKNTSSCWQCYNDTLRGIFYAAPQIIADSPQFAAKFAATHRNLPQNLPRVTAVCCNLPRFAAFCHNSLLSCLILCVVRDMFFRLNPRAPFYFRLNVIVEPSIGGSRLRSNVWCAYCC